MVTIGVSLRRGDVHVLSSPLPRRPRPRRYRVPSLSSHPRPPSRPRHVVVHHRGSSRVMLPRHVVASTLSLCVIRRVPALVLLASSSSHRGTPSTSSSSSSHRRCSRLRVVVVAESRHLQGNPWVYPCDSLELVAQSHERNLKEFSLDFVLVLTNVSLSPLSSWESTRR